MTNSATNALPEVRLSKIGLVIGYTRDTARSVAFYRGVLGMRVVEESPQWAQFDGGGVHLAMHVHPKLPAERGIAHPWIVFEVTDPHATYAALVAKGVVMKGPLQEVCGDETTVGLSGDFEDPDGNLLSILGNIPRSRLPR
jgi:lactoylglutathione lyase